ncbi:MAG: DUF202 domain-containing protein [Nitrospirae bacterium]|nr:DUF202 domain-containing protein [Nitrospirota bacterium]
MEMKFDRLVERNFLTPEAFEQIKKESEDSGRHPEELLLERGIPKHEILLCLSGYYNIPFVEFDEGVAASYFLTLRLDMEQLKQALWFPQSVREKRAEVIAYRPHDPGVIDAVKKTLEVEHIDFSVALPSDLIRIIEHNFDANPNFPCSGGRTPLARVRTSLAYRRSTFAHYRTLFAKGRTGLAFIRTGLSFIVISLLFLRIFGIGIWTVIEAILFGAGIVSLYDGVKWYLPSRRIAGKPLDSSRTRASWGSCVLEETTTGSGQPGFRRSLFVQDSPELRAGWENLSPVMRRRFLASDRTDMAEERTSLAGHRTKLAKGRTGLAFTRTGIAFIGLGIGLIRSFHPSSWTILDVSLILAGLLMSAEGFYWYFSGRQAGVESFKSVLDAVNRETIWDLVFPLRHNRTGPRKDKTCPPVNASHLPGIWATTGLALERTVLADRRCVMARLRSVMAVARTGLAFVRTGMSITSVGAGLMVYFGAASAGWTVFNVVLVVAGLALIVDGYYWIIPAERLRAQYPYCYGDMEITVPDYGRPAREWGTVVFNHNEE